jgi:hypothetical protein
MALKRMHIAETARPHDLPSTSAAYAASSPGGLGIAVLAKLKLEETIFAARRSMGADLACGSGHEDKG